MDKILLIYASYGEGHKRAAQALEGCLATKARDFLDFSYPLIKQTAIFLYSSLTQYLPGVWNLIFCSTKTPLLKKFSQKIQEFIFFPFFKYLCDEKPKVIVATHFSPFSFISAVKDEIGVKLIAIITDLNVHPLWVNKAVDVYFVAIEETKNELLRMGVLDENIICGFVPLREGFLTANNEFNLRQKFGIDRRPAILFMSSLWGEFPFLKNTITRLKNDFNLFVIYGHNLALKEYFDALKITNLHYFSTYEEIWQLFGLSCVIVTKPGGLTIFEGMLKKKAFIFLHYIPGQEKANMAILEKYNLSKFVSTENDFLNAVYNFCSQADKLRNNYPFEVKDIRLKLTETINRLSPN